MESIHLSLSFLHAAFALPLPSGVHIANATAITVIATMHGLVFLLQMATFLKKEIHRHMPPPMVA